MTAVLPDRRALACRAESTTSRDLDTAVSRGSILRFHSRGSAFANQITPHAAQFFDSAVAERFVESYEQSYDQVRRLFDGLGGAGELSDGRSARVIRANGVQHDRPVVEAWSPLELSAPCGVVDLLRRADLRIVKPLPPPLVIQS